MEVENKRMMDPSKESAEKMTKQDKKSARKLTLIEKEKNLLNKIEKAKKELVVLQNKRRDEIADLAFKHQLHHLDHATLEAIFKKAYEDHINK